VSIEEAMAPIRVQWALISYLFQTVVEKRLKLQECSLHPLQGRLGLEKVHMAC
jgi:hypothetical protein